MKRFKKNFKDLIDDTADELLTSARQFFHLGASGGIVLVFASLLAMIVANSDFASLYHYLLNDVAFGIGIVAEDSFRLVVDKPILLWINDGLMAIFFFLVGLEIKRELLEGELSTRETALLPAIAAIGGVALPAAIFYYMNQNQPDYIDGWAIPMATDIAFALGVLALLGRRVPISLKILLTAIAVIDDLIAVVVIALFYTNDIHINALIVSGFCILGLGMLSLFRISSTVGYILLGIIMWVAVLKSGVHATLAGVITALFIPLRSKDDATFSPSKHLEHGLHPWVAFLILPVFGFANAGVSFDGITLETLLNPLTLGIAVGLFFGKQLGVFVPLFLTVKLGICNMPSRTNWTQLYGVSVLCGIGFTMSLFIGGLAFNSVDNAVYVRLGVIIASVLSGVLGYVVLRYLAPRERLVTLKKESQNNG